MERYAGVEDTSTTEAAPDVSFPLFMYISGTPADSQIQSFVSDRVFQLPADADGSEISCRVAPTVEQVLTIKVNTIEVGTITIAAGATTGTFEAEETTLISGSVLTVHWPADNDATIKDPAITIRLNRSTDPGDEFDIVEDHETRIDALEALTEDHEERLDALEILGDASVSGTLWYTESQNIYIPAIHYGYGDLPIRLSASALFPISTQNRVLISGSDPLYYPLESSAAHPSVTYNYGGGELDGSPSQARVIDISCIDFNRPYTISNKDDTEAEIDPGPQGTFLGWTTTGQKLVLDKASSITLHRISAQSYVVDSVIGPHQRAFDLLAVTAGTSSGTADIQAYQLYTLVGADSSGHATNNWCTLPSPTNLPEGAWIRIYKSDNSANAVRVDRAGAGGVLLATIPNQYESVLMVILSGAWTQLKVL